MKHRPARVKYKKLEMLGLNYKDAVYIANQLRSQGYRCFIKGVPLGDPFHYRIVYWKKPEHRRV